jgi:hypothetical protein
LERQEHKEEVARTLARLTADAAGERALVFPVARLAGMARWCEGTAKRLGRRFVKRSIQGHANGPAGDRTQFIMAPDAPMTPERFV